MLVKEKLELYYTYEGSISAWTPSKENIKWQDIGMYAQGYWLKY